MNRVELLLIAIGLSMDAFAAAICLGLTMPRATLKKSLIVGLYFGAFQAVMPLIGYLLATWFSDMIAEYDHWVAFVMLCFIGGKIIIEAFKKENHSATGYKFTSVPDSAEETSLNISKMLPLAVATSVDALAVGISFAFLKVDIVPAVSSIGITTAALSMLGVKIGNIFGVKFKSKAELAGGIVLILIGFKILLEHLGVINI